MLAGDVSVALRHGDLVVNGDHEANWIEITQDNFGLTTVQGTDGTRINGVSNGAVTVRVEDDMRINLKHGDNQIIAASSGRSRIQVPDDLVIRTGGGNDYIVFGGLQVRDDVSITLGSGSDTVFGGNNGNISAYEIGDDLRLKSHGGSHITLFWNVGDDAMITTGHDTDTIFLLEMVVADNLSVRTGSAQDGVLLQDTRVFGKTNISTGSGDDVFAWRGAAGAHDDVRLSMSHGFDEANFDATLFNNSVVQMTGVEVS